MPAAQQQTLATSRLQMSATCHVIKLSLDVHHDDATSATHMLMYPLKAMCQQYSTGCILQFHTSLKPDITCSFTPGLVPLSHTIPLNTPLIDYANLFDASKCHNSCPPKHQCTQQCLIQQPSAQVCAVLS